MSDCATWKLRAEIALAWVKELEDDNARDAAYIEHLKSELLRQPDTKRIEWLASEHRTMDELHQIIPYTGDHFRAAIDEAIKGGAE